MKTLADLVYDRTELDNLTCELKEYKIKIDDMLDNYHTQNQFEIEDLSQICDNIELNSLKIIQEISYEFVLPKINYSLLTKISENNEISNNLIDNTVTKIETLLKESENISETYLGEDFKFSRRAEIINFDYDKVMENMKTRLPVLKSEKDYLALTKLEASSEGLHAIESTHLILYNVLNTLEKIANNEETIYA